MFLFLISSICFGYEYHAKWHDRPDVIICESSNVNKESFIQAIDYWEQRGYNIVNDIIFKRECNHNRIEDTIVVRSDDGRVKDYQHAVTNIKWSDKNLVFATIYISEGSENNLNVLKHELGHAFGIKHTSDNSDIMYKKVN